MRSFNRFNQDLGKPSQPANEIYKTCPLCCSNWMEFGCLLIGLDSNFLVIHSNQNGSKHDL